MDRDKLRDIIYILVAIIFSILAVKIVIWLLPIIIIAVLAYFIYKKLKKANIEDDNETWGRKNETRRPKKNKRIIIDEESND